MQVAENELQGWWGWGPAPRSIWHNPALAETPRAIWHFSPDTHPLLDNKYRGHLLQCGLWDSNTDKIVVTSLRFPSLKFPQKFTGSSNSAYGPLTWILERRGFGEGKGLISEEGDGLIKWGAKVWKKREKARQKRKGMTAYHRGWRKIGPSPSLRTILALKWEMVFHLWDTLQEEYKNRFTALYAVSVKKRSSARLSVPSIDNSGGGRKVCCWGPAQHISINSCCCRAICRPRRWSSDCKEVQHACLQYRCNFEQKVKKYHVWRKAGLLWAMWILKLQHKPEMCACTYNCIRYTFTCSYRHVKCNVTRQRQAVFILLALTLAGGGENYLIPFRILSAPSPAFRPP